MKHKALTLIEMILVLAIFMILISVSVPPMVNYVFSNQIEVASEEVVHVLRGANAKATTQIYDSSWGVYFDTGANSYVLFSGSNYAARTVSHDELHLLPGSVSFDSLSLNGGGFEVIFNQVTGASSNYGTISLVADPEGDRTITINSTGNVSSD